MTKNHCHSIFLTNALFLGVYCSLLENKHSHSRFTFNLGANLRKIFTKSELTLEALQHKVEVFVLDPFEQSAVDLNKLSNGVRR